jgi:LDH2 family malate/lactate/ureidoglycolate dehydrogenase
MRRVPNMPATPNRTIRVPDEIWQPAMTKAHDEGLTLTEVIVKALVNFLRD